MSGPDKHLYDPLIVRSITPSELSLRWAPSIIGVAVASQVLCTSTTLNKRLLFNSLLQYYMFWCVSRCYLWEICPLSPSRLGWFAYFYPRSMVDLLTFLLLSYGFTLFLVFICQNSWFCYIVNLFLTLRLDGIMILQLFIYESTHPPLVKSENYIDETSKSLRFILCRAENAVENMGVLRNS